MMTIGAIYLTIGAVTTIVFYAGLATMIRYRRDLDPQDLAELRRMEERTAKIPGGIGTVLLGLLLCWPVFAAYLIAESFRR